MIRAIMHHITVVGMCRILIILCVFFFSLCLGRASVVVFRGNPAFPPSVPSSAGGDILYQYAFCGNAAGAFANDPLDPSEGFGYVSLFAGTTDQITQNGTSVCRGSKQVSGYSVDFECPYPNCVEFYNGTVSGVGTNGVNINVYSNGFCANFCGSTQIVCGWDGGWAPFPDCLYPCETTTAYYQATNSSGDLLWSITYTYPSNSCSFKIAGDDTCGSVTTHFLGAGQSAYYELDVWMKQGVTPPALPSFGINFSSLGSNSQPSPVYIAVGIAGSGGSIPTPPAPLQIPPNGPFGLSFSAGGGHVLAVKADGSVWAWGDNSYGQLGTTSINGTTTNPVPLTNISGISTVSAGKYHSIALATNGTVWAWGHNEYGEVGNATSALTITNPVQVMTINSSHSLTQLTNVAGIAAGSAGESSYAIQSNGIVLAWGYNFYGQLGLGSAGGSSSIAIPVWTNLVGVVSVAAGANHVLALTTNGTVYAWGYNSNGQLGNGTNGASNFSAMPILIANLTNVTVVAIAAANNSSYALDSSGNVWAWGSNGAGQLGIGTTTDSFIPLQVNRLGGTNIIVGIAAGYNHCLALAGDGSFWSWGSDSLGQLGDGTTTQETSPIHVSFPDGSQSIGIAAGIESGFSIQSDWTLRSWGEIGLLGSNGQLGRTITGSYSPLPGQVNPF